MDIDDTIAPDSDQLDAVDLAASGPQTFTITKVVIKGGKDQPADVHLKEFPRPWRPGKNQRRVLSQLWGKSADGAYEGHQVTLYCDDRVMFGGVAVGGVRISHMSHIGDKERGVLVIISKGKTGTYKVKPLIGGPAPTTAPDDPSGRVVGLMKLLGFDKARMLGFASDVFGREISSASDLTADEMAELADALERETGEDR
jgi:hypothetical protein